MEFTATYSPDDNKLRLTASSRLSPEDYERVKARGFRWAPKQECFYAMWTPRAADLCEELAGEIEDDDITLMDRAEERAERFEEYHEKRSEDAERAHAAVAHVAQRFDGGQPILVGHHSEKRARKDQERIENGMRKAIKAFETAQYWTARAAGALRHAKYKELPAVRARRIKTIEADKRKQERYIADGEKWLKLWNKPGLTLEQAQAIAGFCRLTVTKTNADGTPCDSGMGWSAYDVLRPDGERYTRCPAKTVEDCIAAANVAYPRMIAGCQRWIEHYDNRLAYERAMLAEQGGLVSDREKFEVGGRILRRGEWMVILKVNPQSVTVSGHWKTTVSFDEIKDYKPPQPGDAEKIAAAMKQPPICNYPGEGFRHMTEADFKAAPWRMWSDSPKTLDIKATDTHGKHRVRYGQPETRKHTWDSCGVFLTDKPVKYPPANIPAPKLDTAPQRDEPRTVYVPTKPEGADKLESLKAALKAGVQVVTAPQLFPTPVELAERMADIADIQPGHAVLEPSAGTGRLIDAMPTVRPRGYVVAVEQSQELCKMLEPKADEIHCADFLQCSDLGKFDRIIMNPPFANGADIAHIKHAAGMLNAGGRLVALCANGPRQNAALKQWAEDSGGYWEDLPAGSFQESGTGVSVALLVYEAAEFDHTHHTESETCSL
jgi:hypothetical protein